jgi:hypothetical protein
MVMKLWGKQIVISSAKLRWNPVVKFASELVNAVVSTANNNTQWQELYIQIMEGNLSPVILSESKACYYWCRLWIPDDLQLKNDILEAEHDSKVVGNMGQDKTIMLVRQNFVWPEMEIFIKDYIRSYSVCQRNNAARHAGYTLLQPLEWAYRPWNSISMVFIVKLPVSDGYLSIWIIIDSFTKMAYFIPLNDCEQIAPDLVRIFLKEVWRFHGLPSNIVSDQDSMFTIAFWYSLAEAFAIRLKMSLPFQPQTEG